VLVRTRTPAGSWWPAVAAAAAVVLVPTVLVGGAVSGSAFVLGTAIAAALAWSSVRRRRMRRRAAVFLAAGVSCFAVGDLVRQVLLWTTDSLPAFSAVDGCYLLGFLALSAGMRLLRRGPWEPGLRLVGLIDAAVVFVVLAYLEWELALAPGAPGHLPGSPAVWGFHTLLDAWLLAGATRLWLVRRSLRRPAALVGLASGIWFVTDVSYVRSGAAVPHQPWIYACWLLAAGCVAAAVRQLPHVPAAPTDPDGQRVRLGQIVLVLAPVLIPPGFELASHLGRHDISPVPGMIATAALLALVFARVAYLLLNQVTLRQELRDRAHFSSALAANSSDAVVLLDADGRFLPHPLPFQPPARDGQPPPAVRGDKLRTAIAENHDKIRALVARAQRGPGAVVTGRLRWSAEDGAERWFAVRLVNLLHDPVVAGILVNGYDVTARTVAEQELARRSLYDELTGLANRALFEDRLALALRRRDRFGIAPAVLGMDLDAFRAVNDRFGPRAADQLLRDVADRLRTAVRSLDTVGRLGADEFAVLIEGGGSPFTEAQEVTERVREALAAPFTLDGHQVSITAGIGLATAETDTTPTMLLRDAGIALHRAKEAGRGHLVVFAPEMGTAALQRVQLEADLAQALERGELHLAFQPVLGLATERPVGFEALLRWTHTTLGPIPPDVFIPIAEHTGLIHQLGHWVLEQACHTTAGWQRNYPQARPLSIAVNVSARQLQDPDFTGIVADVLAESSLPASALVLELTETALVDDPERAVADLARLRELGVRLAIDDFGTGYSSLAYLSQFPVDILKIDRSFVATITENEHRPAIVRGLLELARTLGLETVAEGVETEIQRDRLRAERCDMAQGYLFARPLDSAEAELQLVNQIGHRRTRTVPPTEPD
jgi:diguanylate cyclase (GGDEF)-like protein